MRISPHVRKALFDALDRAEPYGLRETAALRLCLYQIAARHGQCINAKVDQYINVLLEEFCGRR